MTAVPARLGQAVPSLLAARRVLTPSRSWSSWWGGGWAGPAAGGCPAPRRGCPRAGRGRWATPATWGSAGAAPPAGRWGPTTWWGRRAPPFWGRAGGRREEGRLGTRDCCLRAGEQRAGDGYRPPRGAFDRGWFAVRNCPLCSQPHICGGRERATGLRYWASTPGTGKRPGKPVLAQSNLGCSSKSVQREGKSSVRCFIFSFPG